MLPKLKKCCWCLSLRTGCFLLAVLSSLLCIADITAGAWNLPDYERPEDNFVAMSMVMFATLSLISNFVILLGLLLRRPGFLQLTILFNSVFILCLFLVAMVTCLFSPLLNPKLQDALTIVLVVLAFCVGMVFILCLFLVAMVICLFSPLLNPKLQDALTIVLVVLAFCVGMVYSVYYMMVVNSTYLQMKTWSESAIPV